MVEASWEARASLKEEYIKKGPNGPVITFRNQSQMRLPREAGFLMARMEEGTSCETIRVPAGTVMGPTMVEMVHSLPTGPSRYQR